MKRIFLAFILLATPVMAVAQQPSLEQQIAPITDGIMTGVVNLKNALLRAATQLDKLQSQNEVAQQKVAGLAKQVADDKVAAAAVIKTNAQAIAKAISDTKAVDAADKVKTLASAKATSDTEIASLTRQLAAAKAPKATPDAAKTPAPKGK